MRECGKTSLSPRGKGVAGSTASTESVFLEVPPAEHAGAGRPVVTVIIITLEPAWKVVKNIPHLQTPHLQTPAAVRESLEPCPSCPA